MVRDFEKLAQTQFENGQKSSDFLNQSIRDNNQQTQELLKTSGAIIQQQADQAISSVTEARFNALEDRINKLCDHVNSSSAQINNSAHLVSKQAKVYGWSILAAVTLTAVSVIGFTTWYGLKKKIEIEELAVYYKKLEYNTQVKAALNNVVFTLCGTKVCIKLDDKSERWGKDGEFILVE